MVWFHTLRRLDLPEEALQLVQDALAGGPRCKQTNKAETGNGPPRQRVPFSSGCLSWIAPDPEIDLDPPWPVLLAARPRHFSE